MFGEVVIIPGTVFDSDSRKQFSNIYFVSLNYLTKKFERDKTFPLNSKAGPGFRIEVVIQKIEKTRII